MSSIKTESLHALILFMLSLTFFFVLLFYAPHTLEISPDSIGYLNFEADRTAGYPSFLMLLKWLNESLSLLPMVQLSLLCASAFFFSTAIVRFTGSFLCGIAAMALLLGNYEVVKYFYRVMTEAVFISALAVVLGCLAIWLKTLKLRWMVAASIFVGVAVAVRPAGYSLFVMLPVLLVWAWGRETWRTLTIAAMIVPASVVLFLSLSAYHQQHQTWEPTSVTGYNLLGKAVSFVDGTERSSRPDLMKAISKIAARYHARFAVGDRWTDRMFLIGPVYDDIRRTLSSSISLGNEVAADRIATRLALEIISAHPAAYLSNIAENYAALWYVPELMTQQDVGRLRPKIGALTNPMSSSIEYALVPRPWPLVVAVRSFQFGVLAVSLVFLVWLPIRLTRHRCAEPILWFGFAVSAALHASLCLIAAINESKPRLMLDNWPLMVLLIILALFSIIHETKRHQIPGMPLSSPAREVDPAV